jgi:hypothetical protein
LPLARIDFERGLVAVALRASAARGQDYQPDSELRARAEALVLSKYSLPSHNERR